MPQVFWALKIPRVNIHQDTPKAFPHITILSKSHSSNWGSLEANFVPREYPGEYTPSALTILTV